MPTKLDWREEGPFANQVSIAQKYGPAMAIEDQDEADAYFEKCVEHMMRAGEYTRAKAEEIERSNLGYYAGYHSTEVRRRVERLFRCAHPVFGSVAENGVPTAEQAFQAGIEMAKRAKESG